MAAISKIRISAEEYLALERQAEYKSEYFAGETFDMSGGTENHNLIAGNIVAVLHAQLRKRPCKVYPSDMRVKVNATGLYTYPDVTVVCGEAQFDDDRRDTLLNPTLIVEVLSNSTEAYDRGSKFGHYRKLTSLAEYLLIAQNKYHIERFVRQPDNNWLLSETDSLQDVLHLPASTCDLALADVYEKVDMNELWNLTSHNHNKEITIWTWLLSTTCSPLPTPCVSAWT